MVIFGAWGSYTRHIAMTKGNFIKKLSVFSDVLTCRLGLTARSHDIQFYKRMSYIFHTACYYYYLRGTHVPRLLIVFFHYAAIFSIYFPLAHNTFYALFPRICSSPFLFFPTLIYCLHVCMLPFKILFCSSTLVRLNIYVPYRPNYTF